MDRNEEIGRWHNRVLLTLAGILLASILTSCAVNAQEPVYLPLVSQNQPTPTDTPEIGTLPPPTVPPTVTLAPSTSTPPPLTSTPLPPTDIPGSNGSSVRFFGNGRDAIDRITVRIDAPERPADVGATDFTVEFWIKANPGENRGRVDCNTNDGWITGNTVIDRDIYFAGDYGDFGIALDDGRVAFGVSVGSSGTTLCGSRNVSDGQWHHVAVTRRTNGDMAIFVDGQLDGSVTGIAGDASYRNGRSTDYQWDPFIVLGAEKHDAGAEYPSFSGWLDELRISTTARYSGAFQRPTAPFTPDGNTVALYHFDEGTGTAVGDSSGAAGGPSDGILRVGGSPSGPAWNGDSPFRE